MWAHEHMDAQKAESLALIDEEVCSCEREARIQTELKATDDVRAFGALLLKPLRAEAEARAQANANEHYEYMHCSLIAKANNKAAADAEEVANDVLSTCKKAATEAADQEFTQFKHQLRIDTKACKLAVMAQVTSLVKAKSKSSVCASKQGKHTNPISVKSSSTPSTPVSPIPVAVQAAGPSPEVMTPQALSFPLARTDGDSLTTIPMMLPAVTDTDMVMTSTALVEVQALPTLSSIVEVGPPSTSVEQMILVAPSGPSPSPFVPPSQDISSVISNLLASQLGAICKDIDTVFALLSSRLSLLESSL